MSDTLWTAQDRARTAGGKALESSSWALRHRLISPLRDRFELLEAPARALGMAALVLLAAGAGVAALLWAAPDGGGSATVAEVAAPATKPPAAVTKPAKQKPAAPTLHGAPPTFTHPAGAIGGAEALGSTPKQQPAATAQSRAAEKISSTPKAGADAAASAATASAARGPRGPVAGPQAIAVARDFANAFVVYEIGGANDAEVRSAFERTTTPELAQALLRRPPRQPATVRVPQAKVLNVVPAPSHGHVYPVSVSLLRVGTTSELRLEMEKLKGKRWRVTNVLG